MTSNYTYPISIVKSVIGVRQTVAGAGMAGDAPLITAIVAQPALYANGLYTYCDPADTTSMTLTKAGLFDIADNFAYSIVSVRAHCGAGSTFNLYIQDRGGAFVTTVLATHDANSVSHDFLGVGLPVLPCQVIKVTTTAAGTVDIYLVKYQVP